MKNCRGEGSVVVRDPWIASSVKKLNNNGAGGPSVRPGGWCWSKTESAAQLLHQSPGPS